MWHPAFRYLHHGWKSRPFLPRKQKACRTSHPDVQLSCSLPPWDTSCRVHFVLGDVTVMDAHLVTAQNPEELQAGFHLFCQNLHAVRSNKKALYGSTCAPRGHLPQEFLLLGAPASWERRPGYVFDFEAECEKLFGSEWSATNVCTVRKKYLWFSSDSDCPPYYGPFENVQGPTGRNPFFQALNLDYDELFDEGWEEDPEGESLSVLPHLIFKSQSKAVN